MVSHQSDFKSVAAAALLHYPKLVPVVGFEPTVCNASGLKVRPLRPLESYGYKLVPQFTIIHWEETKEERNQNGPSFALRQKETRTKEPEAKVEGRIPWLGRKMELPKGIEPSTC